MILIIEDEGYQAVGVTNGLEALVSLCQQTIFPLLILFDLGMPIINGWEFRAHQQRDPALVAIPAIVMSALPDLDRKAVVLNVVDCLTKPIDIDMLIGLVVRYCSRGVGMCALVVSKRRNRGDKDADRHTASFVSQPLLPSSHCGRRKWRRIIRHAATPAPAESREEAPPQSPLLTRNRTAINASQCRNQHTDP